MSLIRAKLSKLVFAINYDTNPDPPCETFCKDLKECEQNSTVCLYRRGHHIFHWSDVILRRNVCKCDSTIFNMKGKK